MCDAENKCDNTHTNQFSAEDLCGWPQLQLRRQYQPFNLSSCEWGRIKSSHRKFHDGIRIKPTRKNDFKDIDLPDECRMYLDYYFHDYIINIARHNLMICKGITLKSLVELENKLSNAESALAEIAMVQENVSCMVAESSLINNSGYSHIDISIFPINSAGAVWDVSSPNKYIAGLLTEAAFSVNPLGMNIRDICLKIRDVARIVNNIAAIIPSKKPGAIDDPFIESFIGRILSAYHYAGGKNTYTANCLSFISAVIDAYLSRAGEIIDRSILKNLMQKDETVVAKRIGKFLTRTGKGGLSEFRNEIEDFRMPESIANTLEALSLYDVPLMPAYPFSDSFQSPRSLLQKLAELNRGLPQNVQAPGWRRRKPKRRVARIRRCFFPTHCSVPATNASED